MARLMLAPAWRSTNEGAAIERAGYRSLRMDSIFWAHSPLVVRLRAGW